MIPFRSNEDLQSFVDELRGFLQSSGEVDLTDLLSHARRFISGPEAEYLHEVYLALKRVLASRPAALSGEREDEIQQVVRQIDETFGSWGTAVESGK